MSTTVAVVGGGYGGATAAKALDALADVVLIEPRDAFVHNVAALRVLVDPSWHGRLFFPYDRLLVRGRVVRDRAVRLDVSGVTLASGERISADYFILATGSTYPFPAKVDVTDSTEASVRIQAAHDALAEACDVLLLGAGPAGLELAGEIKSKWPEKTVTLVDPAADILEATGELPGELRTELRRQLDQLGVALLLDTALQGEPPSAPGQVGTFSVTTTSGERITADIWFRCHGVVPTTDYLADDLATAREPHGHLRVDPDLRLPGHAHIFAIGDVTAIPEAKMAKAAERQAAVAAGNIRTLINGGDALEAYSPGPPGIALPLGPYGGASYTPATGVLGAAQTSRIKGINLRVDSYVELLNLSR